MCFKRTDDPLVSHRGGRGAVHSSSSRINRRLEQFTLAFSPSRGGQDCPPRIHSLQSSVNCYSRSVMVMRSSGTGCPGVPGSFKEKTPAAFAQRGPVQVKPGPDFSRDNFGIAGIPATPSPRQVTLHRPLARPHRLGDLDVSLRPCVDLLRSQVQGLPSQDPSSPADSAAQRNEFLSQARHSGPVLTMDHVHRRRARRRGPPAPDPRE